MADASFDVLIIGGGPAGRSAALILGRCCRNVLVVDAGHPRNAPTQAMHGYLGHDGISPQDFLAVCWRELAQYPGIQRWDGYVERVEKRGSGFTAILADGRSASGRKLLLATGVVDELPAIEGLQRFYGKSVHHCPYCDGFELRGQPLAIYGQGQHAVEIARALTCWSRDLLVFTDEIAQFDAAQRRQMRRNDIEIIDDPLVRLEGKGTQLTHVVTRSGRRIARRALFFSTPTFQHSRIAQSLGCKFTESGGIACRRYQATDVPGVYAAGNAIKDVHLVIVAAAEGAKAAFGINKALTREDYARRAKMKDEE